MQEPLKSLCSFQVILTTSRRTPMENSRWHSIRNRFSRWRRSCCQGDTRWWWGWPEIWRWWRCLKEGLTSISEVKERNGSMWFGLVDMPYLGHIKIWFMFIQILYRRKKINWLNVDKNEGCMYNPYDHNITHSIPVKYFVIAIRCRNFKWDKIKYGEVILFQQ